MDIRYQFVELPNGETLSYQVRLGGEKNILFLHGNMTSSKHWDLLLEKMPPHYNLFALDMRGFGASTYHQKIQSIKDFSDDLKVFVDSIGLKKFSLIGWSAGGAVAMQFAAEHPGYCEKLILLASASTRGYPFYDMEGRRLTTYDEIKQDQGKTIPVQHAYDTKDAAFLQTLWNTLIYTNKRPTKEKYEQYIADMLTQRNLAEVYHALNIFNISDKYNGCTMGNGLAKKINIPVLVLRGDRDLVVTKEMAEEIIEDIGRRAQLIELKNCGHSPLIDCLEELLQYISDFLHN